MPPANRAEVLKPHLEALRAQLGSAGAPESETRVENSAATIRLTADEASKLKNVLDETDAHEPDVGIGLLAESLALILKTKDDVSDYRTAAAIDPELEAKIKESLSLNSQIADSLAADIGALIDQAIENGDRSTAVRLGDFRLAVRQQVALIRRVLAGEVDPEDKPEEDDSQLTEANAEPLQPEEEDSEQDEQFERSKRRYAKLKRSREKEQRTREQMKRIKVLVALLAVAVAFGAVALVVQLIPALNPPEIKILSVNDFTHVPMVLSVDARPPSLFVRVDGPHWRRVTKERRLEIIRDVGQVVAKADYNGARFRDDNGDLVGEFIRGVGSYEFPPQSMD
jgi:hypothetical protein